MCDTIKVKFIKQTTDLGELLANALNDALAKHNQVIWLIPGGSNITISVEAMRQIDTELSKKLVLMQTDERFVKLSSSDCNWYQLQAAGFDSKLATTFPILLDDNETTENVVTRYAQTVEEQFTKADFILGQFGIGADGHTAGILPDSSAARSKQLVAGYESEDFQRVTLTFTAISQLQAAYGFVFGENKQPVLLQLRDSDLPLDTLPSGILKHITNSTIYNDCIE